MRHDPDVQRLLVDEAVGRLAAGLVGGEVRRGDRLPLALWKVYATCDDPSTCDEIVPNTAGAVDTPPFPWQNRGTFHQIEKIAGHGRGARVRG